MDASRRSTLFSFAALSALVLRCVLDLQQGAAGRDEVASAHRVVLGLHAIAYATHTCCWHQASKIHAVALFSHMRSGQPQATAGGLVPGAEDQKVICTAE